MVYYIYIALNLIHVRGEARLCFRYLLLVFDRKYP